MPQAPGGGNGIDMAKTDQRRPSSEILAELLDEAQGQNVTLDWLLSQLGTRSFGMMLLVVAPLGLLPGISPLAGILLIVPAYQMILGRPGPVFPRRLGQRQIGVHRLAALLGRIVPLLRYLERLVRPRWTTPFEWTKRVVGGAVLLLGLGLLIPLPLSNVPPALTILLISFAYLEEDGILLCLALCITAFMLTIAAGLVWQTLSSAGWLPSIL